VVWQNWAVAWGAIGGWVLFSFLVGARILYLTATGMPAPRRLTAQAFWGDQATPPMIPIPSDP